MKIAILSANLGNFDTPIDPVKQIVALGDEVVFHRYTDDDFPPILGLTPRFQYRIPKMFGWEMFPGYDVYIWLDGGMSLQRPDCVKWLLEQLGNNDMVLFRHPWRGTIKDEVEHIERKLKEDNEYISSRYKNGLHRQQYEQIYRETPGYEDDALYASTVFVYKNRTKVKDMMKMWWFYQSRYFTCDQVVLPWLIKECELKVAVVKDNLFKIGYISLVSKHH